MKNDHGILTDFDGPKNFTKQISEKLDETIVRCLEEYGFHKDYLETNNSEFSIHVWPHVNVNFGTEEQFRSTQYDVYHCEEKLFTIDVIVKNYLNNDGGRLEIILDTRKWKEVPNKEEMSE